jgi:hypothetical protein
MPPNKHVLESQPFSRVLAAELAAVRKRREHLLDASIVGEPEGHADLASGAAPLPAHAAALAEIANEKAQRLKALDMHLTGLAISGGGIRSATFALGLLQGLAELGLLKRFDYISTVSGGGYIGGWLVAWTKREGNLANVHKQLCFRREDQSMADRPPLPTGKNGVVDEEPEPVHHLRSYSSYLAPRSGLLTADTWSLLAIYARNLLINFLILLPATIFTVTLVRLGLLFFRAPNESFATRLGISELRLILGTSLVFLFALALVFNVIGMELFKMQEARNRKKSLPRTPARVRWLAGIVLAALFAAIIVVALVNYDWVAAQLGLKWVIPFFAGVGVIFLLSAVYYGVAVYFQRFKPRPPLGIYKLLWYVIGPLVVSAVLSCWLFSINPIVPKNDNPVVKGTAKVVVEGGVIVSGPPTNDVFEADGSNFVTRLRPLGYKVLIAPYDPPEILADQAPKGPNYEQSAFEGWKANRFFWWPALVVIGFFAFMHGVAHLFINWLVLFRLLADDGYIKNIPAFSASRVGMLVTLAIAPFVSGAVGGLLFYVLVVKGLWFWHHQPHALVTFGPPLALVLFTLAAALEIGLLGRRLEEDEREWWARVGALALLAALAWVLLFAAVLYVPWLIELAGDDLHQRWLKGTLTLGWLVTSIGGAVAGRSPFTGNSDGPSSKAKEFLAQIAPPIFVVGLLSGVSLLVDFMVNVHVELPNKVHNHWAEVDLAGPTSLGVLCALSASFTWLMAVLVDVNLFSLHSMYANRLIRAYLGASRKKRAWTNRWLIGSPPVDRCGAPTHSQGNVREENPISGFDFDDDIPLIDLRTGRISYDLDLPAYWGSLPLINTSLNLVSTRELDWQERKAESFLLSPLYCGSLSTGYQPLPDDFRRGNMTLGRAVAISGAAADPNMGHHTSPAVIALMTVFNTRLGWWIENPSRGGRRLKRGTSAQWSAESPSFGGLILKELAGQTDSVGRWVHLSDGGHFENLAAYELIRRRCRYIVISDGGCDPTLAFEDLANLIRKCRTDFGIRIEVETSQIQKKAPSGASVWHCAIGKIRYDDVDGGEVPGTLVYVKSSMTGDEPPDLQQYARSDPTFPHQTTADQFFDETQFESYRALGYHIAHEVFQDARDQPMDDLRKTNPVVFSRVRNRWFPAPPELEANFEKVADGFEKLQQTLRSDHNLRALTYDLYPELGPPPADNSQSADPVDRTCAELHAVNQLILLMEKAWTAVKLEGFPEHPVNRGWMNQFRRLASADTVRRLWPILGSAFSKEFVKFCEQELMLPRRFLETELFDATNDAQRRAYEDLRKEFAREWPGSLASLDESFHWAGGADAPTPVRSARAWLILDKQPDPFAYGLALQIPVGGPANQVVHEITIWVRPAYRNLRIGQRCFEELFASDSSATLRARYPKEPPGGDKIRLELWKFFHFGQQFRPAGADPGFLVLERRPHRNDRTGA